jgi:hypothetical protein
MLVLENRRKQDKEEGDCTLFWFALATSGMETETTICFVFFFVGVLLPLFPACPSVFANPFFSFQMAASGWDTLFINILGVS